MKFRSLYPATALVAAAAALLWLAPVVRADRLVYTQDNGAAVELKPADGRYPIVNQPIDSALVNRPGDRQGLWINPATQPATPQPPATTPPVVKPTSDDPTPPPVIPTDPRGLYVRLGSSWAAAVKAAKAGQVVYLQRGATWTESCTVNDLRSVTIAAFGTGPVPVVRVSKGSALVLFRPIDVLIDGVAFTADKPTDGGVRLYAATRTELRNLSVSGFTMGVTLEVFRGQRNKDVTLRACTVANNYNPAPGGDSSGMFASCTDGLTVTACDFDTNGWREGVAKGTERNHDVYVAGDNTRVAVTSNRFARPSSHGLQLRSGGVCTGNVFFDCPIGMSFGLVNGGGPLVPGGVSGEIRNNQFVGTRLLAGQPRGWAMEIGNCRDAVVQGNVFASDHTPNVRLTGPVAAIKLDVCKLNATNPYRGKEIRIGKLSIADDNACTWPGGLVWVGTRCDQLTKPQTWAPVNVSALRAALK